MDGASATRLGAFQFSALPPKTKTLKAKENAKERQKKDARQTHNKKDEDAFLPLKPKKNKPTK